MKDIKDEMHNILTCLIHHKLNETEDIFNVDWDVYYATVFLVKEKIKFRLAEFTSALPYNLDTM